jgi:D-alanyl-D-alanine carboxypeptidase
MSFLRLLTSIIILVNASALCFSQIDVNALKSELQTQLEEIIREEHLPGATFAVVLPEGQAINIAAGYNDREAFMPMTPDTRMLVGSTGKTFVAALVLQMVDKGLLHLDARVASYFGQQGWFTALPNHEYITVRMLLQHTSGLPRYVFSKAFKSALAQQPYNVWTPKELLTFIARQPARHEAGKGWFYSDTNYLLLGLLLEEVSGKEYYALLRENIIKPLALTFTNPSDQPHLEGLSQGYIGSQDILGLGVKKTISDGRYAINPQFEWTGGGLISNSNDLAQWMWQLHQGEVISSRLLKEMNLAVSFDKGIPSDTGYGLGNFVWQIEGKDVHYGHEGIMPGYVTSVEYASKDKIALAIQINTDEGFTTMLHQYLLRMKRIISSAIEASKRDDVPAKQ